MRPEDRFDRLIELSRRAHILDVARALAVDQALRPCRRDEEAAGIRSERRNGPLPAQIWLAVRTECVRQRHLQSGGGDGAEALDAARIEGARIRADSKRAEVGNRERDVAGVAERIIAAKDVRISADR